MHPFGNRSECFSVVFGAFAEHATRVLYVNENKFKKGGKQKMEVLSGKRMVLNGKTLKHKPK